MESSPPGSSIHGILQVRILEWVAISFSRGSSQTRDWTWVSCIAGRFFTNWATREAYLTFIRLLFQSLILWLSMATLISLLAENQDLVSCRSHLVAHMGKLMELSILGALVSSSFTLTLSCSVSQFSSVQSLSHVRLPATPWIAARQASQSITNSWSSLKLMSIELAMPSSHLILCRPLLLLPPIPPGIRGFSNESTLRMRWPKYWSFSFSISPSVTLSFSSPRVTSLWYSQMWILDNGIPVKSQAALWWNVYKVISLHMVLSPRFIGVVIKTTLIYTYLSCLISLPLLTIFAYMQYDFPCNSLIQSRWF